MNFLKTWLLANLAPFLKAIKSKIATAKTEAIADAKTYTDTVAGTTLQSAKDYADTKLSQLDVIGEYKGSGATVADLNALAGKGNGDIAILTAKDGNNKPGIYVYNSTSSTFEFVIEIKSADAQALVDTINSKIGDLSTLSTSEQSTLVGAINEVLQNIKDVENNTGDLTKLDTTDKSNLVASINEVLSKIVKVTDENGNENGLVTNYEQVLGAFDLESLNSTGYNPGSMSTYAVSVGMLHRVLIGLTNGIDQLIINLNSLIGQKANLAGSSTQTFSVADATDNAHAVNKGQFDFTITDQEALDAYNNA